MSARLRILDSFVSQTASPTRGEGTRVVYSCTEHPVCLGLRRRAGASSLDSFRAIGDVPLLWKRPERRSYTILLFLTA